ncbi:hypothetical protein MTO96_008165 [Rhipicephalus appendiculatus]
MDQGRHVLYTYQLPEDENETRNEYRWIILYLVLLLVTEYLVEWLISMKLDILNYGALSTINPVDVMVRGSLEYGVPALIYIFFNPTEFRNKKRIMQLDYAPDQFLWRYLKRDLNDYTQFMLMMGAPPPWDKILAQQIKSYDDDLRYYEITTHSERGFEAIRLNDLGNLTKPYVTSDYWSAFISVYTDYIYTPSDYIYYQETALQILVKIYKHMGERKLRYLVAWKFFSYLVRFTDPYFFLHERPASGACYDHVREVMGLAVISPLFKSGVLSDVLEDAEEMLHEIRYAYVKAMQSSTWLSNDFVKAAVNKTLSMVVSAGSAGRRLKPEFVEALYNPAT